MTGQTESAEPSRPLPPLNAAMRAFGEGVRRHRGRMSQRELSRRLDFSQSNLSRIERGSLELSLRDALKLQRQFGLRSIEELFGSASPPPSGRLLFPEVCDAGGEPGGGEPVEETGAH